MLTAWRIRTYPRAVALAVGLGWLVVLALSWGGTTPQGAPLGGDWVVFHAAGAQVLEGTPERLLDPAAMQAAQAAALGRTTLPGYHAWVYPPYLAVVLAPFAALPFAWSYVAYTVAMVAALGVTGVALARTLPRLHAGTIAAAAVGFYPLTRAVVGGQNTPVTLALAAVALALLARGRDGAAGVALGLMAFKPHFGLPVLAVVALTGRWRVLPTAALVGAGWYLLGAALLGPRWPAAWLHAVRAFRSQADVNGAQLVSLSTVAEHVGLGTAAGAVAAGLVGLVAIAAAYRARRRPELVLAVVLAALPLAAPHVQYYDLGLLVLPAAVVAAAGRWHGAIVGVWVASWALAPLQGALPVHPLLAVALVAAAVTLHVAWDAARTRDGVSTPRSPSRP